MRRGRRFFVRGALILMYHRVASVRRDPWRLCVSPEQFAQQMEMLRAMHPLSLADLLDCMRTGRIPRRGVVVTFDDGYADNFHSAWPVLRRQNVPATVFVVSGQIGGDREFWWDELERVLFAADVLPDRLQLRIGDRTFNGSVGPIATSPESWTAWEPQKPGSREALYYELWSLLQPLPHLRRLALMDELLQWANLSPVVRPEYRALNASEMVAMTSGGSIEIGAHSLTHSRLSSLPADCVAIEIARAKADLEGDLGRPVQSFAYPYGHPADVGAHAAAAVAEAGFECACSSSPGLVEAATDRYLLPRFHAGNWPADEFERRVQAWLTYG
jgi:peptidoglycan/xylan/chitin deacetylase (PgdA/CDA1 family)